MALAPVPVGSRFDPPVIDPRDRGGPAQPLLIARELRKHFPVKGARGKSVQAVDGVSFTVRKGETLGIVGESGCGKSTLARLLLHLVVPDDGELVFDGEAVGTSGGIAVNALRRQVQIVFQDSYSSLNPRMPVRDSVAFGPFIQGRKKAEARDIARDILAKVGLNADRLQAGEGVGREAANNLAVLGLRQRDRPRPWRRAQTAAPEPQGKLGILE